MIGKHILSQKILLSITLAVGDVGKIFLWHSSSFSNKPTKTICNKNNSPPAKLLLTLAFVANLADFAAAILLQEAVLVHQICC